MTKLEALELLIKNCHSLKTNMNDTFHYACADSGDLEAEDALDLVEYIQVYGRDAILAYEAIKRGYNPEIPNYLTPAFLEVKELLISKMNLDTNFLCDLNFEKREELEQIREFGGKLSFKFKEPSLLDQIKGQKHFNCFCSCEGTKLIGKGKNMKEAKDDLKSKLNRRSI